MKTTSKKDDQLVGRTMPEQGTKARAVLEALIDSYGQPISEPLLRCLSGTDYIKATVATLRDMGWVIVSSVRHERDSFGKSIGIVSFSLNQIDNGLLQ
jgi:hypothetical protein